MKIGKCKLLWSLLGVFVVLWCVGMGCQHRGKIRETNQAEDLQGSTGEQSAGSVVRENLSMAKDLMTVSRSEFVLGPEDTIQISVYRHDDLTMETTIGPWGMITYYLIGDVQAAGLTQYELRDSIRKGLSKYIRNPEVVVKVTAYRSRKIFMLGEINKPGVYQMRNNMTLLEAISEAGGITSDAYLSGAYVVREGQILLVNFHELIKKGNTGENIPLLPNDAIYIPDNREQKVYVLGEVNRQSAVPMQDGLTLLGAIAEAGGFNKDAQKDSVVVMRGNFSAPEIMIIDAKQPNVAGNIPLAQGDIIYVATSSFANVERVAVRISNILRPFYEVARGIVWGDAAIRVLDGERSRFIIDEE